MKFEDGKCYKIKLLKEVKAAYGWSYGNPGDILEICHKKRYAKPGMLCTIEGHGYGTCFEPGVDFSLIEEIKIDKQE